jgi:hypothetical protein
VFKGSVKKEPVEKLGFQREYSVSQTGNSLGTRMGKDKEGLHMRIKRFIVLLIVALELMDMHRKEKQYSVRRALQT